MKYLVRFFGLFSAAAALGCGVSCENLREWYYEMIDGSKPPPVIAIAPDSTSAQIPLTPNEAVAKLCDRLIMRFSMQAGDAPAVWCDLADPLARETVRQLDRSRITVPLRPDKGNLYTLVTVSRAKGVWHVRVRHEKTGRIFLDETYALREP